MTCVLSDLTRLLMIISSAKIPGVSICVLFAQSVGSLYIDKKGTIEKQCSMRAASDSPGPIALTLTP